MSANFILRNELCRLDCKGVGFSLHGSPHFSQLACVGMGLDMYTLNF